MAPFARLHTLPPNGPQGLPLQPRVRKVLATAAIAGLELDIPSTFIWPDTKEGEAYQAMFPLGKIPGMEVLPRNGKPTFYLSESNAQAGYLAECAPSAAVCRQLLGGDSPEERASVQQWIWFCESMFEVQIARLITWRMGIKPADVNEEFSAIRTSNRCLAYMENHLKDNRKWFATADSSPGPSVADLTIAGMVYMGLQFFFDAEYRAKYPKVFAWYDRVKTDPKVGSIFEVEYIEKRIEAEGWEEKGQLILLV